MRFLFKLVRPTIFLLTLFAFLLLIISIYLVFNDGVAKSNRILGIMHLAGVREEMDLLERAKTPKSFMDSEHLIMFLFSNADGNKQLQNSFTMCLTSLFSKASNPQALHFYIAGDVESYYIAKTVIQSIANKFGIHNQILVSYQNISQLEDNVLDIIHTVRQQISSGKEHRFSSPLFYLSIILHKVMPHNISQIILLDVDLVIASDISKLFSLFNNFDQEQAIGIARENQPVYQTTLWEYRKNNPKTRVGEPPPKGLTGFNSGVVLFDLQKLRVSSKYNSFLTEERMNALVQKYKFQGHLGDQDFYTLLSFDYEELFYILPCGWNRQLCQWWKHNGLGEKFDLYYSCSGVIHIWHGNCETSLLNYTTF
ncbi:xyloside xylosyltransferase 1-like [Biomphalaria glabrata]|uniref:Xyloside xylosyltransferase 1-like n=1 Tax=Biomphalaria glabrata TaxID=6526 RepID=A0A9U8EMV9_BIOGL|nr:xyloside xylosyltransferase 1-like [Biomphalaria glabrata]